MGRRDVGGKRQADPDSLKKDECRGCPALCCRDLVMPTDRPRTRADVDELKWHIQYDGVSAFVANRRWYIQVRGRCMYLTQENLCSIYANRPQRCRRHNPPDCERHGDYCDVRFDTPEELEAYFAARREACNVRRRALRRARKRPSTSLRAVGPLNRRQ